MNALFMTFGISVVLIYWYVCLREDNYINAISPFFAFYFTTSFIFEPVFFNTRSDYHYDIAAFFEVYSCDFLYFLGLVAAYCPYIRDLRKSELTANATPPASLGSLAWALLLASALVFMPVAIQFLEFVFTDPRRLYELTRSGFGQYLFISSLLLNLSVICFLFSNRRASLIFIPSVIILSLLKGAKGPVLLLAQIVAMWAVYVRGMRVGISTFLVTSVAIASLIGGLFAFTLRGIDPADLAGAIAQYSDYNRHAALTVTEPIGPFYGRLALEGFVYSRVPRVLFPGKPKDFGALYLAEQYFPHAFAEDAGAPAFGAGVYIADFGSLAPIALLILGLCSGLFLGLCLKWLKNGGGVVAFIPMLYFANISLIPIPLAFLGIEHWLLGQFVGTLSHFKIILSRDAPEPGKAAR